MTMNYLKNRLKKDFLLPIFCKKCGSFVSGKLGSERLVCLGCQREYDLRLRGLP